MDFTSKILTAGSRSEAAVGVPDTAVAHPSPCRADPDPIPDAALHESSPDDADAAVTTASLLDGRYCLTELLGRGGSGAVYLGTDLLLRRPVAVKIFHSSATEPITAARQRAEMMFLARLNHPNLVSIYDARVRTSHRGGDAVNRDDIAESSYLVMEFVDGTSLAQRLSLTAITLDEAATVGIAVANALAAVHEHGLVHRDVKPANILLPAAGGAKLTDFGIARQLNSAHLTTTAEVMGTPLYLSPEQATGDEVGSGTDIYSLGLVLLECVTGNPEFPGAPVQSAMARLLRDPLVPRTLPAPWPDLLRSMTGPIPVDRPTADAVAAVLTGYLNDRERSRTAITVTATATPQRALPDGGAPDNPAIPGRHHRLPGVSVAAAPTVPRLTRDLTVLTCGVGLAVLTAVIVLTATAGEHPAGPVTTTEGTTTRTITAALARTAAATPIPVATGRADWHPAHAVTVLTTATATTTETTTTSPNESTTTPTVPSESTTTPTVPSESRTPPTVPSESRTPPTVPSESTTPPSESTTPPVESTTPPTTPDESTTASATPPDTAVR